MISSDVVPTIAVGSATHDLNATAQVVHFDNTPPADWYYTHEEDIANTITHAIGIVLSIIGMLYLMTLAKHSFAVVILGIYGLTSLAIYSASTAYHFVRNPILKRQIRLLDHCSIYLIIAGSYTPYLTLGIQTTRGTIVLLTVWSLALLGSGFRLFATNQQLCDKYSLVSYIGLGWTILLVMPDMLAYVPSSGILWLAVGGAFFMVGIIFYRWDKLPFNHAIWHLFVLAGSISHFVSIMTLL